MEDEIELFVQGSTALPGRGHTQWIHPAGCGANLVDPASVFADEGTALPVVLVHLQQDHRILEVLVEGADGVFGQELPGRHAEAVLQSDDVIGCQEDVDVAATIVEARNARGAGECE
jgi:hypothetical protein